MFDPAIYDAWLNGEDDSAEVQEFLRLTAVQIQMIDAVHGTELAAPLVKQLADDLGYGSGYPEVPYEDTELAIYLDSGDVEGAISELLNDPNLAIADTRFAAQIHGLRCYVFTGLLTEQSSGNESYQEQLNALTELVAWAGRICASVPAELVAMPRFRILAAAAEARLAIDLGHAVDQAQFAALASCFRDGTPEQIRKTVQNQVAAQQLEVNDQRQLLPSSAIRFLRGAGRFPSLWTLPGSASEGVLAIDRPVFVPVCPPLFGQSDCPFLPGERHDDGYHVGTGGNAKVFADYWDALDWLTKSPEPAFQPRNAPRPVRCRPTWIRVSAQDLTGGANG